MLGQSAHLLAELLCIEGLNSRLALLQQLRLRQILRQLWCVFYPLPLWKLLLVLQLVLDIVQLSVILVHLVPVVVRIFVAVFLRLLVQPVPGPLAKHEGRVGHARRHGHHVGHGDSHFSGVGWVGSVLLFASSAPSSIGYSSLLSLPLMKSRH
jgi:hypothetical protein